MGSRDGDGAQILVHRPVCWNRIAREEDRTMIDFYPNRQDRQDPGPWRHWSKAQAQPGGLSRMEHSKKELRWVILPSLGGKTGGEQSQVPYVWL